MKQLVEEELRQEKRMREYEQCRVEMTRSLLSRYILVWDGFGWIHRPSTKPTAYK